VEADSGRGGIRLPDRPAHLRGLAAAAWSEPILIDTYPLPAPDRNPLFLERRVYQGSSGRVYPNPVTERVSDDAEATPWQAVHLENEYLRVMVLPQIGGRIHVVQDRKTGYDLFYRQNVIKPALVGLLGPWISGGVELNWPQHHRPSTFWPTDWTIETGADGSVTVWCSEHEPMERMKGMHGVVLRPGSSVLELQVRLVNRTPLVQTFLWWANVAVRVHDRYEAFFPPDVTYVADHARRAMTTFPVATGRYYGVDYGARPPAEADLRWYRNIPVPTSYMCMGSAADFFGGYDHAAGEGYVHWADHTISPGKKLWTWGDHEFGHAWDRELTDHDGPYVELMAGVFTDNQPDFSFLLPGEVRTFSQAWYPLRAIGPAHAADRELALHLSHVDGLARVGVAATREHAGLTLRLTARAKTVLERTVHVAPDRPFVAEAVPLPAGTRAADLHLAVFADGEQLLSYQPTHPRTGAPPPPAAEPPPPERIGSLEGLWLTGMHLQQYRHATRRPEAYFREALRRDPGDSRCNLAMGEWHLRRGEYVAAERHLRAALARLGTWNANPRDGEASYLLGLTLRLAGDAAGADAAFGKAAWNGALGVAAGTARAELAAGAGHPDLALELLDRVLAADGHAPLAQALRAALLRRTGRVQEARAACAALLADDPLDVRALHERDLLDGGRKPLPGGAQTALDIAHDEARAGLLGEAVDALERALAGDPGPGQAAMLEYTLAWLEHRRGHERLSRRHLARARSAPTDYVFPSRLEEIEILGWAMAEDATDARAPYYLGNLLYDKRRHHEAIRLWRRAARLAPTHATTLRNLGIAEADVLHRPDRALAAYRRAQRADPTDARVLYELDQLRKRMAHRPEDRLRALERRRAVVAGRDDLTVELVTLLNLVGRHEDAIRQLSDRRFHPWEGGEGLVSAQWLVAHRESARAALARGEPGLATELLQTAMTYPPNLGEGKHLLTPENELHYLMGRSLEAAGDRASRTWFERASLAQGDPDTPAGDGPYWQALATRKLGRENEAVELLAALEASARSQARATVDIPFFATSLPTMLVFDDDLSERWRQEARYLLGLAALGFGRERSARARFMALLRVRPDHQAARSRLHELARRRGRG
jgi:tetratricopeptide (TPR) repeat protein